MKYVFFKKGRVIFIKAATLSLCAEAVEALRKAYPRCYIIAQAAG